MLKGFCCECACGVCGKKAEHGEVRKGPFRQRLFKELFDLRGVEREALMPEEGAVCKPAGIEEKKSDIAASELDVEAGHLGATILPKNLLNTEFKIHKIGGFKGDREKLVHNRGMDSGNGVTEKYNQHLLRGHIQQRAECDLCLVCERFRFVENDHLWPRV